MTVKKMNEKKKKKHDLCAGYTCPSTFLSPDDVPQSQTVFPQKDDKKRISISHLLEGN